MRLPRTGTFRLRARWKNSGPVPPRGAEFYSLSWEEMAGVRAVVSVHLDLLTRQIQAAQSGVLRPPPGSSGCCRSFRFSGAISAGPAPEVRSAADPVPAGGRPEIPRPSTFGPLRAEPPEDAGPVHRKRPGCPPRTPTGSRQVSPKSGDHFRPPYFEQVRLWFHRQPRMGTGPGDQGP